MGLYLVGGYYDKKEALVILMDLKYYSKDLVELKSSEELVKEIGIIPYMRIYEKKIHEDFLVDKLNTVKSILFKQGDEAIDLYKELTSPNEDNFIYPLVNILKRHGNNKFANVVAELSIPMKKDEFEWYLDIYNQFIKIKDNSTNKK